MLLASQALSPRQIGWPGTSFHVRLQGSFSSCGTDNTMYSVDLHAGLFHWHESFAHAVSKNHAWCTFFSPAQVLSLLEHMSQCWVLQLELGNPFSSEYATMCTRECHLAPLQWETYLYIEVYFIVSGKQNLLCRFSLQSILHGEVHCRAKALK